MKLGCENRNYICLTLIQQSSGQLLVMGQLLLTQTAVSASVANSICTMFHFRWGLREADHNNKSCLSKKHIIAGERIGEISRGDRSHVRVACWAVPDRGRWLRSPIYVKYILGSGDMDIALVIQGSWDEVLGQPHPRSGRNHDVSKRLP